MTLARLTLTLISLHDWILQHLVMWNNKLNDQIIKMDVFQFTDNGMENSLTHFILALAG